MAAKKTKKTSSIVDSEVEPLSQFVCDRVKELRKQKGWTLEQLSVHSNVSRSMLSQVERGNANPTLVVAFRIAQAFSVSLADLVEGVADRSPIDVVRGPKTRHPCFATTASAESVRCRR